MEHAAHPQRIHEQLEQYWEQLRGDRALPREDEINPDSLKEVWDSCYLVTARADGSLAYSYLGKSLVEAYGDDVTGREVTEHLVYPHPDSLFATFKEVVATGKPATDESEFTNSKGNAVKYRSCVLPLTGHHRDGVGFLLGGMKWKAY
jgi:hypothetical protein